MKLFHIAAVADEVTHVNPDWLKTIYSLRGCSSCGYLRNNQRTEPLDVDLDSTSQQGAPQALDMWHGSPSTRYPTAPVVNLWGVGFRLLRRDLIEDLRLDSADCALGRVRSSNSLLNDYQTVVLRFARWIFGIRRPLIAGRGIKPCEECGRLGMQSNAQERLAVKESIQREGDVFKSLEWPDVYDFLGIEMVITARAADRIRSSIHKEIRLTEIPVISINDLDFASGIVNSDWNE